MSPCSRRSAAGPRPDGRTAGAGRIDEIRHREESRASCPPITPRSWLRWPSASRTQRSFFDLDAKQRELSALREQAAAPDLWEDPDRARRVMRRMASVEADLQEVEGLSRQLSDLETLNELALEEADEASGTEVRQGLEALTGKIDDLEVLAL